MAPWSFDLLSRVEQLRPACCDLVVLTGGEPFRQNIAPLVQALLHRGLRVRDRDLRHAVGRASRG